MFEKEIAARKFENKKEAYIDLINSLQKYMNIEEHENLTNFQLQVNKVTLIGSNSVLKVLIPFYSEINNKTILENLSEPDKEKYHSDKQDELIRAIRNDLGESNNGLLEMPLYGIKKRL